MLCSLSAPKSTSNWLDRLRASKGFPISPEELDLDHFLSSSSSSNPNPNPSPNPNKQDPPPTKEPIKPQDDRLFNLVTNVLSDLFVMGNPQQPSSRKKSSRKQSNPRILVPSSASGSVEGEADKAEVSPSSADHSVAEAGRDRAVKVKKKKRSSIVSADADLAGFSRTEVTVIDTSSPGWKSEKVVFRKGMVWKVREKKLRRSFGGRKKRKLGLVEKLATDKKDKSAGALEKEEDADKEEDFKATNEQSLVPRRSRQKFLRSTHAPATKYPSVCRLESISTSKNNEASEARSALKEK